MKLNIKKRLFLSLFFTIISLLLIVGISLFNSKNIENSIVVLEKLQKNSYYIENLKNSIYQISVTIDKMLLQAKLGINNQPQFAKYDSLKIISEKSLNKLSILFKDANNETLKNNWTTIEVAKYSFISNGDLIVTLIENGRLGKANELLNAQTLLEIAFTTSVKDIIDEYSRRPYAEFEKVKEQSFALKRFLIVASLIGLFLGFLLNTFIYRSIITPLKKLQSGVEVIGSGNLNHNVASNSPDEIGVLSRAFDKMRIDLQSIYQTLENKVKERTDELSVALKETTKSEKRFKDIVANTYDWIWEVDADANYTFSSESVKDIMGYTVEEIIGKTPYNFMIPEEINKNYEIFNEIISKKKPMVNIENWSVKKNGEKICLLTNGVPLLDKDGNILGYRGVDKDITEQKLAEEIREKYIKEINSINKKLENYSYTISHDLKEPIRSIRTFTEFIMEDHGAGFDNETSDYFNRIMKASNKMSLMIDDMLILSKIGRVDVQFKTVLISEILDDVLATLRERIEEKNVEITTKKMPSIVCQPVWIIAVFQNLISNSIKYGNGKGTKIEISYKELKDYHQFSIKDNGNGIPEDQHQKIFGLFRKAHQDRNVEGSGAGLAIVSTVVEQHYGKIWVSWSNLGEGSTITFTIKKDLT